MYFIFLLLSDCILFCMYDMHRSSLQGSLKSMPLPIKSSGLSTSSVISRIIEIMIFLVGLLVHSQKTLTALSLKN